MERITLVVNEGPGSVRAWNAMRLAAGLMAEKFEIFMFLLHDGTYCAKRGQNPIPGLAELNMEKKIRELMDYGVKVMCCSVCADARGITSNDVIEGVPIASIVDLAKSIAVSKHVITI